MSIFAITVLNRNKILGNQSLRTKEAETKNTTDSPHLDTLENSPLAAVAMGSLITHIHRQVHMHAHMHARTHTHTHTHTHLLSNTYTHTHTQEIDMRKKRRKMAHSTKQSVPQPVWLFFMDYRSFTMGHSSNKPSLWTMQPNKHQAMD